MAGTEIIRVEGVSKRFILHKDKSVKDRVLNITRSRSRREDFWALRDVDLTVTSGETLGLVGHNGSGKSTLLKIIGGIIEPSGGQVSRRGRLAALLELGAGFHPELTGRENVMLNAAILGLSSRETKARFDEMVAFSGIEEFIDTQVKFYSSGMYVRLAFAVAVHIDPDILLVDEVLAVGDEPFQRKCMDKIRQFQEEGRTIVVVSHSAQQIGELCDRVAVLNHGSLVFEGDPAEGLRVLRAGYEAESAVERDRGPGRSDGPEITDVKVRASDYGREGRFASGSDITVEIRYRQKSAPVGWIAGIDIENALGQQVYRVNTQGLGSPLPTGEGEYTLSIELPANRFGGGSYRVYASCVTSAGTALDRSDGPAIFEVEDDASGSGLFQFEARAVVTKR